MRRRWIEAGLEQAKQSADRLERQAAAALSAQGAAPGEVQRRLMLRYDGADAALPVALGSATEARAAFEAAHRRLFGFAEPQREVLIASVEVEAESLPSPLRGERLGMGVTVPGVRDGAGEMHRFQSRPDNVAGPPPAPPSPLEGEGSPYFPTTNPMTPPSSTPTPSRPSKAPPLSFAATHRSRWRRGGEPSGRRTD